MFLSLDHEQPARQDKEDSTEEKGKPDESIDSFDREHLEHWRYRSEPADPEDSGAYKLADTSDKAYV